MRWEVAAARLRFIIINIIIIIINIIIITIIIIMSSIIMSSSIIMFPRGAIFLRGPSVDAPRVARLGSRLSTACAHLSRLPRLVDSFTRTLIGFPEDAPAPAEEGSGRRSQTACSDRRFVDGKGFALGGVDASGLLGLFDRRAALLFSSLPPISCTITYYNLL